MYSLTAPIRPGATLLTLFLFALLGVFPTPALAQSSDDTDYDNLSDAEEANYGTHYQLQDSDSDGLTDGQEVLEYRTNPLDVDTDDDGYSDGWEVSLGFNPLPPEAPADDGSEGGGGGGGGGSELPEFVPDHACIVDPDECSPVMKPAEEPET